MMRQRPCTAGTMGRAMPYMITHACVSDPGRTHPENQDRWLAVGNSQGAHVLNRVDDLGHFAQPHRRAVPIDDHEVAIVLGSV